MSRSGRRGATAVGHGSSGSMRGPHAAAGARAGHSSGPTPANSPAKPSSQPSGVWPPFGHAVVNCGELPRLPEAQISITSAESFPTVPWSSRVNWPSKLRVAGSSPVSRSTKCPARTGLFLPLPALGHRNTAPKAHRSRTSFPARCQEPLGQRGRLRRVRPLELPRVVVPDALGAVPGPRGDSDRRQPGVDL